MGCPQQVVSVRKVEVARSCRSHGSIDEEPARVPRLTTSGHPVLTYQHCMTQKWEELPTRTSWIAAYDKAASAARSSSAARTRMRCAVGKPFSSATKSDAAATASQYVTDLYERSLSGTHPP